MQQEKDPNQDTTVAKNSETTTKKSSAKESPTESPTGTVLRVLKKEYLTKLKDERYPDTPKLTAELDELERAINTIKKDADKAK